MSELAGFGIPDFLPVATRRAWRAEEIREHREAKEAEADRERAVEIKRSGAMALYAEQAAERGEFVSAHALATGQVAGRTVADIFASAELAADRADAVEAARERKAKGEGLNICLEPPRVTRAESPEGREVANIVRHYSREHPETDVMDRAFIASEARRNLRRNRPVF